ncbi:hypothetical protein GCM10027075_23160 [Streptomyces heilongjiangensis]
MLWIEGAATAADTIVSSVGRAGAADAADHIEDSFPPRAAEPVGLGVDPAHSRGAAPDAVGAVRLHGRAARHPTGALRYPAPWPARLFP